MSRSRAIVALLALVLVLPSAVFAQGAGDDQYQDPFGDEQTQNSGGGGNGGGGGGGGGAQGRAAQDDGLSDAPPVSGDDSGSGNDTTPPPDSGNDDARSDETADDQAKALPNTGSDPRILAYVGLIFVLVGVGLRLRTIDPDLF
jgi:LPXTG-motif cell wall-anchored protein